MPLELKICLFISGIALMIALTVRAHRQTQRILELYRQQQLQKELINGIKYRISSNTFGNSGDMGCVDQFGDDQESDELNGAKGG